MPNITEYSAPRDLGLQPSDRAPEALAGAGRRIAALYSEAGEAKADIGRRAASTVQDVGTLALKYSEHREISHTAATAATTLSNLDTQWNDLVKKSDPNDPTLAAKFREETLEPTLQKLSEGALTEGGQRFAEAQVEQMRNHFMTKTSADMSTLAGVAVKANYEKTVNSLSSAAANDPSSLDFSLKAAEAALSGIAGSSPNLSGTQAAQVKTELLQKAKENIVKAAISGMITKNPNIDLEAVQKKYGEFVNGADMKTFQRAAQTQAKADELHDKQLAVAQRQTADLQVHTGAAKVLSDNVSFDPTTGQPIVDPKYFKQALELAKNNPNAPSAAETVRTMLSWGESQQNKANKIVDDPNVKKDLTDRLFDPDRPTSRIDLMKAQAEGKLSHQSFQAMSGLVKELETTPLKGDIWKSTTQAVKDRLIRVDLPEGRDAVGAANYASFMQAFLPEYIAKSRAGTLEPNALNLNDPKSMISQALQPYRSSLQDRLRTQSNAPQPTAAAPAKREDAMPAIPPPDQRSPGLYQTPKMGTMRWTGTGWVKP